MATVLSDARAAFELLQSETEKLVKQMKGVEMHRIPSGAFFVYRPGRPSLRMDVEQPMDSNEIVYASAAGDSEPTKGHFTVRKAADGSLFLNDLEHRYTPEEAANLITRVFL